MTIPMLALWSLTVLALLLSIFALSVALRSSGRSLSRQLYVLSTQSQELAESHEALSVQLRNLRSRLNMQASRARKAQAADAEPSDGELPLAGGSSLPPDEWKRRMNLQLATGRRAK